MKALQVYYSLVLKLLVVGAVLTEAVVATSSRVPSAEIIWFVEGNSSNKSLIPSCSDMCISILNQEMEGWREEFRTDSGNNIPVGLYPCRGKTKDELWQYESRTGSIKNIAYNDLCLAAGSTSELYLSPCTRTNTSQISWIIQQGMSMATSIRLNNSAGRAALYINKKMPNRKNKISELYLDRAQSGSRIQAFTVLNYSDPYSLPVIQSAIGTKGSRIDDMVVRNGDFEECGIDPGSGFMVLGIEEPIPLCGWQVVEGKVEYVGSNMWPAYRGNRSLHLHSAKIATPGSVAQILPVNKQSNYSLVFYMAGHIVRSCGNTIKTLRVSVTPSTVLPQVLLFDVKNVEPGKIGWKKTHSFEFTALEEYVNLTFKSLTPRSCGPIIDNVEVMEIKRPTEPFSPGLLDDSHISYPSNSYSRMRMFFWIMMILGILLGFLLVLGIYYLLGSYIRKCGIRKQEPCVNQSIYLTSRPWDSQILSLLVHQRVKKLSWKELEKSTNNFTSVIGEGGFSKVYLAHFPDETVGAVKVEKKKDRSGQTFKQELSVLLSARHVHLTRQHWCLNTCLTAACTRLHFDEHCNRRLPWQSRMTIAFQVAAAIEYLHEVCKPPIVHSDIKSANVLLDEKFNAKLCDFGFSKAGFSSASVFHSTVKGLLGYLDPHYCKSGVLSKKSDIYSFGVLLLELVTGKRPFSMEQEDLLTAFALPYLKDRRRIPELVDGRLNGYFHSKEAETMVGISALCIQEEANMRPSMTEILRIMREVLSPLSITTSCNQMEEIVELYEEEEEEKELGLISGERKQLNIHEIEEDVDGGTCKSTEKSSIIFPNPSKSKQS
eukprot:Gb_14982 [translate_table: standard]